eukprot:389874-Pyramimonas_sp.AAC.1
MGCVWWCYDGIAGAAGYAGDVDAGSDVADAAGAAGQSGAACGASRIACIGVILGHLGRCNPSRNGPVQVQGGRPSGREKGDWKKGRGAS